MRAEEYINRKIETFHFGPDQNTGHCILLSSIFPEAIKAIKSTLEAEHLLDSAEVEYQNRGTRLQGTSLDPWS